MSNIYSYLIRVIWKIIVIMTMRCARKESLFAFRAPHASVITVSQHDSVSYIGIYRSYCANLYGTHPALSGRGRYKSVVMSGCRRHLTLYLLQYIRIHDTYFLWLFLRNYPKASICV